MVPFKSCVRLKYELDNFFFVLYTVNFHLGFSAYSYLRIPSLKEAMEKLTEINTFQVEKNNFFLSA